VKKRLFILLVVLCLSGLAGSVRAEEPSSERFSFHGQTTVISQAHAPFHAPYSGPNSLANATDEENTFTTTLFSSLRLWKGGELYFDPEAAAGGGLSGGIGLAGITNGEATRVGTRALRISMARLYWRQTVEKDRLVWTVGKFSVLDVFDINKYAHDPRTQFMNWGLMANSAWDYPADARGYTWGASLELSWEHWSARAGSFLEPEQANGTHLESDMSRANGSVLEIEHRHQIGTRAGTVRVLGFWNKADMGHYQTAIQTTGIPPDVTATRTAGNRKYGAGLNAEQELSTDLGAFLRLSWNDGHTETWAFDEVDRTASAGLSWKGAGWSRPDDVIGLAILINGLSSDHRDYLAAGGAGFLLGDGRLNYGTEKIVETYYLWKVWKFVSLTLDFQGVENPGYNKDRGPVAVGALRLHAEF
jgi:high affinity Mn2+ porin